MNHADFDFLFNLEYDACTTESKPHPQVNRYVLHASCYPPTDLHPCTTHNSTHVCNGITIENVFFSLLEKDESLPANTNSLLHQEINIISQPPIPADDNNPPKPELSDDGYKTRNILLDNASVQSFEETLYLGASKPIESSNSNDSCSSEKIATTVSETGGCNDQQTVESEATTIAQEW